MSISTFSISPWKQSLVDSFELQRKEGELYKYLTQTAPPMNDDNATLTETEKHQVRFTALLRLNFTDHVNTVMQFGACPPTGKMVLTQRNGYTPFHCMKQLILKLDRFIPENIISATMNGAFFFRFSGEEMMDILTRFASNQALKKSTLTKFRDPVCLRVFDLYMNCIRKARFFCGNKEATDEFVQLKYQHMKPYIKRFSSMLLRFSKTIERDAELSARFGSGSGNFVVDTFGFPSTKLCIKAFYDTYGIDTSTLVPSNPTTPVKQIRRREPTSPPNISRKRPVAMTQFLSPVSDASISSDASMFSTPIKKRTKFFTPPKIRSTQSMHGDAIDASSESKTDM